MNAGSRQRKVEKRKKFCMVCPIEKGHSKGQLKKLATINRECNHFFKRNNREYLNEMLEEIQIVSERKDPRTMYKTIKQFCGGKTQRVNLIKDGNGNLLVEN
jgi:ABC-type oligopeptide transport system ATPase subunit